jgi:hypothetical protein
LTEKKKKKFLIFKTTIYIFFSPLYIQDKTRWSNLY